MPKRKSTSLGRGSKATPAAKRKRSQWSTSMFGSVVEAAGMALSFGKEENELSVEPTLFQRSLASEFKQHSNLDEAVSLFCEGLSEYIDEPTRLRMSLLPTKIAQNADVMARFGGLASLMRLLLGVQCIQPSVVTILVEKLPEYMDDACAMDVTGMGQSQQIPSLVLSQLRWLDSLVNGKDLCSKLLEVVSVAPLNLQKEIITALPEVLDDTQHENVAKQLKSILETSSDLTAAIIDALSGLNITLDLEAEMLDVAMDCVASAAIADLPTVIKFIMQNVTTRNAQEMMTELRLKLAFDSTILPNLSSTQRSSQAYTSKMANETSDQFMVFDTIKSAICFQQPVALGWIKALESVSEPAQHKAIDVVVLFILHSLSARRKAAEALFCSKIKTGCFTEELMELVFGAHAKALREFFPSILALCENLLCSPSPTISNFAISLYQNLFTSFDTYCQQEVVAILVTHVGSGQSSEIDNSLEVLSYLVEFHHSKVQRFSVFIRGVLDYLEHLSVAQIRRLYSILSTLAFHDADHTSMQDEMHTIIRKQLSHAEAKYRRMGVIGAVKIIEQLARCGDDLTDTALGTPRPPSSQGCTLTSAQKRQAVSMVDEVMKSCERSAESVILFSDEMASVVQRRTIDPAILSHLGEEVTTKFQEDYLVELTTDPPQPVNNLPVEFQYSLDQTEDGSIALNLFSLVCAPPGGGRRGGERGGGVRCMAAQFRLLWVCEKVLKGNLEGVDALLGCPVVLCSQEKLVAGVFEELPLQQRLDVCLSHFHCINWFRELICAFAGETDGDMKYKIIKRLKNITELLGQLEPCMSATASFWPPSVTAEVDLKQPTSSRTTNKKGRSAKSADCTLASITVATQNIDKSALNKTMVAATTVKIDSLRPFFRELCLDVFAALEYSSVSRTLLDSESQTQEREELSLDPPQLLYLLQDLSAKVAHTLSAFRGARAKGGSFTAEELVAMLTNVMPDFCKHLGEIGTFLQEQLAACSGMVDVDGSSPHFLQNCLCFNLILKCMAAFFSWPSLSDAYYTDNLRSCMEAIVSEVSSGPPPAAMSDLAEEVCKYFKGFVDFLPTLTCAHSLGKLMVAISKVCKAEHSRPAIAEVCADLLKRPWRDAESRQQKTEALNYLLKYHIEWAPDRLALMEAIAGDAVAELMGEQSREQSQLYPTLCNSTFPVYYRSMMSALVSQLRAIPALAKNKPTSSKVLEERMCVFEKSVKVLYMLIALVKSFDQRSVLGTALKYGRLYVELFIKVGIPVLDKQFREHNDEVQEILKTMQQSTRSLQHFCTHSKVVEDVALTNHVPQLKRCLETLVFRVKGLLSNHNAIGAFKLGNLKNRDLQGHIIPSQVSQQDDNGEGGEEEEEPGDSDNDGTVISSSTDPKSDEIDLLLSSGED